jgi:hypothetical protein
MPAPIVAAAAVAAAAALFQQLQAQQAAKEAEKNRIAFERENQAKQERLTKELAARQGVQQAQQNQIGIAQRMGDNEQSAIDKLIAVFARSAR